MFSSKGHGDFNMFQFIPVYNRDQYTYNGKVSLKSRSMNQPHQSEDDNFSSKTHEDHRSGKLSVDDSDLEARLNSWNLGLENPRYLREKTIPLSLMSPKVGMGKNTSRDEKSLFHVHERELSLPNQETMSTTSGDYSLQKFPRDLPLSPPLLPCSHWAHPAKSLGRCMGTPATGPHHCPGVSGFKGGTPYIGTLTVHKPVFPLGEQNPQLRSAQLVVVREVPEGLSC
uniref:Uncharacterized protein n=1 Tax=Sphaerodactylus townsendi TaxID=933632 RepID=A0ACB8ELJ3_9SAUR